MKKLKKWENDAMYQKSLFLKNENQTIECIEQ